MFGFSPCFFRIGLNLGLVSYNGRFRVTITSDKNTGFELNVFRDILEEELDAVLKVHKQS